MKKKQLTRERIFRNNRVELSLEEREDYAREELLRQTKRKTFPSGILKSFGIINITTTPLKIDKYDPFFRITILTNQLEVSVQEISGYSKRMPNDVPNDRIAIQVAVSRLIKRLKNG